MDAVTLCVTDLRQAAHSRSDAERRTIVRLSFRTLQRGNACRDALRHRSARTT
ncbi:DUF1534 domain-containing protein [Pseudomonas amygdali pv. lachrymans str. M301315]|uniref:DUF1534 domain-containing protein n=1 Tax=Pseudomonas amygdali pv. lachrymans str. M301315 TaxID=629260 RepID=A0AAD0M597_PSEAV|nr:DUF1534 domain-containing protein [Pseudomonas amygdali pv. lachrymans str. M301315]PWD03404.1 hypothetical protein CX658_12550 [Pseudomonas amygdali pv. lachrymans]QED87423.1 DUF1534 domain-containing protein [Pseudomonas amygdali pv. tabaci str. ATCC 11528]QOI07647.1 DUF1534 domain-containing protein [Pseudomonas savastanoi]